MPFLEPLTRQALAAMKGDGVEISRRSDVNMILKSVYNGVIHATIKGETHYRDNRLYPIYLLNAHDENFIIQLRAKLRQLFPDSVIDIEQRIGVDGLIFEMAVVIDWS